MSYIVIRNASHDLLSWTNLNESLK